MIEFMEEVTSRISMVYISPDSRYKLHVYNQRVEQYDFKTGELLYTYKNCKYVGCASFSPNGRYCGFEIFSVNNQIKVIDLEKHILVYEKSGGEHNQFNIQFINNEKFVYLEFFIDPKYIKSLFKSDCSTSLHVVDLSNCKEHELFALPHLGASLDGIFEIHPAYNNKIYIHMHAYPNHNKEFKQSEMYTLKRETEKSGFDSYSYYYDCETEKWMAFLPESFTKKSYCYDRYSGNIATLHRTKKSKRILLRDSSLDHINFYDKNFELFNVYVSDPNKQNDPINGFDWSCEFVCHGKYLVLNHEDQGYIEAIDVKI
jgi:hypothetical protein